MIEISIQGPETKQSKVIINNISKGNIQGKLGSGLEQT